MALVVKKRNVSKPVKNDQGAAEEMTIVEGTDPAQQGINVHLHQNAPAAPQTVELSAELQAIIDQRVEAVRKEEKDKLYPEIQRQKEALELLQAEKEERDRLAAEEQAEREAEAERQRHETLTFEQRMEERDKAWEDKFALMQQDRDREAALREREAQVAQIEQYRTQAIAANQDNIAPQFHRYIRGNSPEEIDAAVAQAIADTNEIASEFQEAMGVQRRQSVLPMSGQPPTPVAGPLAGNPGAETTLTPDDIRNMSLDDYMANRQQILAAASARGPYG